MDILIAEDDTHTRRMLELTLQQWGHRVRATADGESAYALLSRDDSPPLAILDWMMPKLDGLTLCRRLRQDPANHSLYIILLTACIESEDIVDGLDSGADDYITKPFGSEELRARINAGVRLVSAQQRLSERVAQLEEASRHIKQLQGLLAICSYCKSIRNERDDWQRVEQYIIEHSDAHFSHGICPKCFETIIKSQLREQGVPTDGLNLDGGVFPQ